MVAAVHGDPVAGQVSRVDFKGIFCVMLGAIRIMHCVAMYVTGDDEHGRMVRRTLMRYLNLSLILVLRSISSAVKRRFPTLDHVVESGSHFVVVAAALMTLLRRFHDAHRAGNVRGGAERGVQHLLDPQHVVHQSAEAGQALQSHHGLAGAQNHHGGAFFSRSAPRYKLARETLDFHSS
jgi:Bestrophin, RFP-TM, chloride channel